MTSRRISGVAERVFGKFVGRCKRIVFGHHRALSAVFCFPKCFREFGKVRSQ